jgi:chromosomal replication initiator protein DnaA
MLPVLSSGGYDNETILETLRTTLENRIGPRRYRNWFGGATRMDICGAQLQLFVASPYHVKWVQKQFESILLSIASEIIGPDVSVEYIVGTELTLEGSPSAQPAAEQLPEALSARTATVPKVTREALAGPSAARRESIEIRPRNGAATTGMPVQPSVERRTSFGAATRDANGRSRRMYSLSDFVVGEANALPMAAVQQFLTEPELVSPLYLHGGVGNGKTHLLEGIRARLRKDYPQLQVLLLTAEQFGNYFSQALSSRSLPSFRAKFRNVDVLLVDDVDFFDGKKGFQEEFLHTLKQFEQQGRYVAVTSNRHPRLLTRTSDELVSRFLSGLVGRIESPDEKMRLEIVTRHANRLKARFTPDALQYVASRFTGNVRELEGAVNVLATWSQMTRHKVTISVARQLLGRLERDCMKLVRVSDVENAVCEFFGVEAESLRSQSRKRSLSQPRMLAMYLARKLTQSAYNEIGAHFGGRNHSTVMSAERKIAGALNSNSSETIVVAAEKWSLQEIVETLEQRIKAG